MQKMQIASSAASFASTAFTGLLLFVSRAFTTPNHDEPKLRHFDQVSGL